MIINAMFHDANDDVITKIFRTIYLDGYSSVVLSSLVQVEIITSTHTYYSIVLFS